MNEIKKPALVLISSRGDLETGDVREVSRIYANPESMARDLHVIDRNEERLTALRVENGDEAFELSFEQFAAIAAYYEACRLPTPNAEGVHVGDIFYDSWGYEQTNVNFYQVVALRGAHTAVVREIGALERETANMSGDAYPVRDCFVSEREYTVRTKKNPYYTDMHVIVNVPGDKGRTMERTDDFTAHTYSSYY